MTALSILDLVRVTEDTDARGALDNARDIAVHAEAWGYRRIWVAEHHNMQGIASAATSVVLGLIAAGTKTTGSAPAASCCPIMHPTSSPSTSGRWRGCFPAASTSGWAAHRPAHPARLAPHA